MLDLLWRIIRRGRAAKIHMLVELHRRGAGPQPGRGLVDTLEEDDLGRPGAPRAIRMLKLGRTQFTALERMGYNLSDSTPSKGRGYVYGGERSLAIVDAMVD